jgi:hypothetical protein
MTNVGGLIVRLGLAGLRPSSLNASDLLSSVAVRPEGDNQAIVRLATPRSPTPFTDRAEVLRWINEQAQRPRLSHGSPSR